MWMIWETGTRSLREIVELLVGLDYAAVSQRIRRIQKRNNLGRLNGDESREKKKTPPFESDQESPPLAS
jgi:hypothetical protein